MTKRLIIDSKLASLNQELIFDEYWSWPVSQNQYDDPIIEFIKWSDELHKELGNIPRLLDAFFLIKSDLIKDLTCYTSAWIDVSKAKQENTELIFGPHEHILESLTTDNFVGPPPTVRKRNVRAIGLAGSIKSKLSRLKRSWTNNKTLSGSQSSYYATSMNDLGKQISPRETSLMRLYDDNFKRMPYDQTKLPNHLDELARQISDFLCKVITEHNATPSRAFNEYMYFMAFHYLTVGWAGTAINPILKKIKTPSTLITGTGSGYLARLLSYQFLFNGNNVLRTTHGGDAPFFNDVLHPTIEFPFASKYIAYGERAAQTIRATIDSRSESEYPFYTRSVIAAGSNFHSKILKRAEIQKEGKIKSVTVVAGTFMGAYRGIAQSALHDLVYMEWQRRLLLMTKKLGYTVTSKRHPKGIMSRKKIFQDCADNELLGTTMADVEQHTDAYIFDFQGGAFMEAICTLKPVVLIDIPIRSLRCEARSQISESISIIPASFDEQNRVVIDERKLEQALANPVDINARKRLIYDYLLRPS
ncbi:MAG: hypothetical protein VYC65_06195 [Chloroflexota bacterium]|nr:hypothetical protein [Chloroflexota bacterium]